MVGFCLANNTFLSIDMITILLIIFYLTPAIFRVMEPQDSSAYSCVFFPSTIFLPKAKKVKGMVRNGGRGRSGVG